MRKIALPVTMMLGLFIVATPAHAQATRTWVSGVGDDVNPCSRTAPCKTFAGAISKTAAGGEINVLDPGGFGTVNINNVTIENLGGSTTNGRGVTIETSTADVHVTIANSRFHNINNHGIHSNP